MVIKLNKKEFKSILNKISSYYSKEDMRREDYDIIKLQLNEKESLLNIITTSETDLHCNIKIPVDDIIDNRHCVLLTRISAIIDMINGRAGKNDTLELHTGDDYYYIVEKGVKIKGKSVFDEGDLNFRRCQDSLPVFFSAKGGDLEVIKNSIFDTKEFADSSDYKLCLRGVFFFFKKGVLSIRATDTLVLAYEDIKINNKEDFSINLNKDALSVVEKLDNNFSEITSIDFYSDRVVFKMKNKSEVSIINCEDGYPDFEKVIPKKTTNPITIDVSPIEDRLELITNDKNSLDVCIKNKGKIKLIGSNSYNKDDSVEFESKVKVINNGDDFSFSMKSSSFYKAFYYLEDYDVSFCIDTGMRDKSHALISCGNRKVLIVRKW